MELFIVNSYIKIQDMNKYLCKLTATLTYKIDYNFPVKNYICNV